MLLLAHSRSTVFEEHDGEEVLESVLHLHAGAGFGFGSGSGSGSVPAQNLSELLPLIANRSAAGGPELPQVGPGARFRRLGRGEELF